MDMFDGNEKLACFGNRKVGFFGIANAIVVERTKQLKA